MQGEPGAISSNDPPRPAAPARIAAPVSERLTDSPWFWLALFGAMALISLLVVQEKFARRQGRLEQRYQDRLLTQQMREQLRSMPPVEPAPAANDALEPGYEDTPVNTDVVRMSEARATTSLIPLVALSGLIMLGGLAGLLRRHQRLRLAMLSSSTPPGDSKVGGSSHRAPSGTSLPGDFKHV